MDINYSSVLPFLPVFLKGAWVTVELSALALLFGLILGIIGGLFRVSNTKILQQIAFVYIWIFRGTPLLIQLFIIYFGLPQLGIKLGSFESGVFGLALNTGAYATEIVRSGIQAVDKGQQEAAFSLGMSKTLAMIRVVGPQAAKIIIPPMVNQFIMTIKNSSMVSLVAITELFRTSEIVISSTFRSFEVYTIIAILYLSITSIFMVFSIWLEKGLNAHDRA